MTDPDAPYVRRANRPAPATAPPVTPAMQAEVLLRAIPVARGLLDMIEDALRQKAGQ